MIGWIFTILLGLGSLGGVAMLVLFFVSFPLFTRILDILKEVAAWFRTPAGQIFAICVVGALLFFGGRDVGYREAKDECDTGQLKARIARLENDVRIAQAARQKEQDDKKALESAFSKDVDHLNNYISELEKNGKTNDSCRLDQFDLDSLRQQSGKRRR